MGQENWCLLKLEVNRGPIGVHIGMFWLTLCFGFLHGQTLDWHNGHVFMAPHHLNSESQRFITI